MRGFRGGIGGGVLKALSLGIMKMGLANLDLMPRLPEMNVSRSVRRYGPASTRTTTYHRPHGQRERDRRKRQIAAGSLRHANGLDRSVPEGGHHFEGIKLNADPT